MEQAEPVRSRGNHTHAPIIPYSVTTLTSVDSSHQAISETRRSESPHHPIGMATIPPPAILQRSNEASQPSPAPSPVVYYSIPEDGGRSLGDDGQFGPSRTGGRSLGEDGQFGPSRTGGRSLGEDGQFGPSRTGGRSLGEDWQFGPSRTGGRSLGEDWQFGPARTGGRSLGEDGQFGPSRTGGRSLGDDGQFGPSGSDGRGSVAESESSHEGDETGEGGTGEEEEEVLGKVTEVVRAVMELSNRVSLSPPDQYIELVKVSHMTYHMTVGTTVIQLPLQGVGMAMRELLHTVDGVRQQLPQSSHHEVRDKG